MKQSISPFTLRVPDEQMHAVANGEGVRLPWSRGARIMMYPETIVPKQPKQAMPCECPFGAFPHPALSAANCSTPRMRSVRQFASKYLIPSSFASRCMR